MDKIKFNDEGKSAYEKILSVWPKIIRKRKEEKLSTYLSLLMYKEKKKIADQSLVIEAARFVFPKSYDPIFHMIEDIEKFRREMLEPFKDINAYRKMPVKVRRWKRKGINKKNRNSKKRITAFCASPRKNGNTDLLIEEALKGAQSVGATTEKIMLQDKKIKYCIGCRRCKDPDFGKICIIKDDMDEIYQKIIDSDSLIIGFPIYTGRECAQLSTFFDRWDAYERYMLTSILKPGRTALVIGTWGYTHIDTYDHIIETVISILNLHKVETIEAISACAFEGILHGLDEKRIGIISKYPKELKKAYEAGKALALS
ncbi:MAG: flavodoxin family protein [Candidatus Schekmanbacteria bacterium]|nr:MAG: flavodoxin family protein [Candidatus Schekmanbacteria bacterium]